MSIASFTNADPGPQALGTVVCTTAPPGSCILASATLVSTTSNLLGVRLGDVASGSSGVIAAIQPGLKILMTAQPQVNDAVYLSDDGTGRGTTTKPSTAIQLGVCYEVQGSEGTYYALVVPPSAVVSLVETDGQPIFESQTLVANSTTLDLTSLDETSGWMVDVHLIVVDSCSIVLRANGASMVGAFAAWADGSTASGSPDCVLAAASTADQEIDIVVFVPRSLHGTVRPIYSYVVKAGTSVRFTGVGWTATSAVLTGLGVGADQPNFLKTGSWIRTWRWLKQS